MKIKIGAGDTYFDRLYHKRNEFDFAHQLWIRESIRWVESNEGEEVDYFCVLGDGTTMICIGGHGEIVDSDLVEEV